MQGTQVLDLIQHQSSAWQATLSRTIQFPDSDPYVFCGSGSSYYLAQIAAHFALSLGFEARAVASTDVILDPDIALRGKGTLIVISRSGTTTEALWAASEGQARHWTVIGVSCHADSPLVLAADQALISPQGEDHTIVMIQSFSSMLFLLQNSLRRTAQPQDLATPDIRGVDDLVQQTLTLVPPLFESLPRRLYLLGSGARHGIAQEGALKAQEMSNQCALAYSSMEFRHGPWGSLTPEDMVIVLGQTRHRQWEHAVVNDLLSRTGKVMVIAQPEWFDRHSAYPALVLPATWPDLALGPLAIIPLQFFAWKWTIMVGKDPDHPANITQVVHLDDPKRSHSPSEKRS